MAFCGSCGSEVQGRFCAKCGAAVAAGPAAPPPQPPPAYSAAPPQQQAPPAYSAQPVAQSAGMEENVASALCYVLGLLTGVLFLVLAPYNQNRLIRFHAFQSIFLHLASIVVFIGLMIVIGILHFIPFLGAFLGLMLYPIVGLCFFALYLILIFKAYNKERWVLPIIGPLAEKQA